MKLFHVKTALKIRKKNNQPLGTPWRHAPVASRCSLWWPRCADWMKLTCSFRCYTSRWRNCAHVVAAGSRPPHFRPLTYPLPCHPDCSYYLCCYGDYQDHHLRRVCCCYGNVVDGCQDDVVVGSHGGCCIAVLHHDHHVMVWREIDKKLIVIF